MDITISDALSEWDQDQLANLAAIMELENENPSISDLEEHIKWLYHSKTRAQAKSILKKIPKLDAIDDTYHTPTFSELIFALADKLKVNEKDASLEDCEEYISHEILIEALQKMSPSERKKFFMEMVNLDELLDKADLKGTSLKGPMTTVAVLGAAQASGMSIYLASTTALGFLTHAVGITLPFAAYTGLTSTIAFVIGPAGWLAAGGWALWQLTGPSWKKLTPAILYIISTNSHRALH